MVVVFDVVLIFDEGLVVVGGYVVLFVMLGFGVMLVGCVWCVVLFDVLFLFGFGLCLLFVVMILY